MGHYIGANGYYEGDKAELNDIEVPQRPNANYDYINGVWVARVPSIQEQRAAISAAIQKMLDDKAMEYRYDSIMSARSYAGYVNPFQAEATKLATWSADCWAAAAAIEVDVLAGTIPMPTPEEAVAMMPVFVP